MKYLPCPPPFRSPSQAPLRPGAWLMLVATLAAGACSTLSEAEEVRLNGFRERAKKYFDAGQFQKVIGQAESGLVLKPDDYDLEQVRAWSYLQLSGTPSPRVERDLLTAEKLFGRLMEQRSVANHDPRTILGHAVTLHNRARVEAEAAERLRRETSQPGAADQALAARAEEHERLAENYDQKAEHFFKSMTDGNTAPAAHRLEALKYRMALAYRRQDHEAAIAFGLKSLELNAKEAATYSKDYTTTQTVGYEKLLARLIEGLKEDELKVRSRLAAYYTELKDYANAIVQLDAILAARPNSYQDYYLRGDCKRALDQHEAARKDFQKFLQLSQLSNAHTAVRDALQYLYGKPK